MEILNARLANHHLATPHLDDPTQLVAHLGAVQAQDYPAAKWALAQRMRQVTDEQLEAAFAEGKILRTHVLRPTWHFVAPRDIRWMLALTGPRVRTTVARRSPRLEEAFITACEAVIAGALEGGNCLTRADLGVALRQAGMAVDDGPVLAHLVGFAELDALICSGPRRGLQHTYALLDERVPPTPGLDRETALAELTWRYFSSHGPALAQDCAWWSGLTVREVNRGLELNGSSRLCSETLFGRRYWFHPRAGVLAAPETAYLLPNFDEYTVAYRERDLYFDRALNATGDPRQDVPFNNVIVVDGQVVGRWKRVTLSKQGKTKLEIRWSISPSADHRQAVATAASRYAAFLGRQVEIVT